MDTLKVARFLPLIVVAGVLCCSSATIWASVTARVSGTINDPRGGVIANVKVVMIDEQTGIQETTLTDTQGFYSFPSLPVGHYDIDVNQPGFKAYSQTGLIVGKPSEGFASLSSLGFAPGTGGELAMRRIASCRRTEFWMLCREAGMA